MEKRALLGRGAFALGAALIVTGISAPAPQAPKIRVYSCQVMSGLYAPALDEVGLAVRFENDSPSILTSIVWRAKFKADDVDFIDDGSFSSGVRIDNFTSYERGNMSFNSGTAVKDAAAAFFHVPGAMRSAWDPSIALDDSVQTEDPANCSIVRATFDNGAIWINPALPQFVPPFPVPTASPKPSPGASPTPSPTPDPLSPPAPPVVLKSCIINIDGRPRLHVKFHNASGATIHRVVVRAPYSGSSVDFVDQGSFLGDDFIDHTLSGTLSDAFHGRYFVMEELSTCSVLSVDFADGSTWQNPDPNLAASPPPLPTPFPDALDPMDARNPKWQIHGQPTPFPTASPSSSPSSGN